MDNDTDEPEIYGAWLPQPTAEQKQADLLAKQRLESSVPVIQEMLDWFDTQISIYRNPLTIEGVNPSTNPETVKTAVLFAQIMITEYKQQRDKFASQFRDHITDKENET